MKLNEEEKEIAQEAKEWVKKHKELLIEKFANDEDHPPQENPVSFFTGGSFGAGKTEYSKQLQKKFPGIVLIDADEIRKLCPQYDGKRASIFNKAAFKGQHILHNHALYEDKHFVLDSTFSARLEQLRQNINRSLSRNRPVEIYYVYQDPKVAWLFTQVRERLYGRHIAKDKFINSIFEPKEKVDKIKSEFGDKIRLNLVINTTSSDLTNVDLNSLDEDGLGELESEVVRKKTVSDIENIDRKVPFNYSKSDLRAIL